MATPEIDIRPVESLIPYARNSRTHSDAQVAQIAASIDEFGMVGAIVVRDGVIAKGHGTLAAVRKLYAAGKHIYPPPGRAQNAEPFPDGTVPVLYGWKPTGPHRWYSDRKQTTVWNFDRPNRNDVHPTMKPVALIEYPITNSSRGGDVVLDLFGGSGSTLIACEKTGRHARLMELEPRYCDVIITRWQNFTGQQAKLGESDMTFSDIEAARKGDEHGTTKLSTNS